MILQNYFLDSFWLVVKFGLVVLSGMYFIFTLVTLRQVNLMAETLITELSPAIKLVTLLYTLLVLGLLAFFIVYLF